MSGRTLIDVRDLWKSFGDNHVLRGLSLELVEGETLVVLGPSGCGKSVLLKHIIGLLIPDRGEVLFCGENIFDMSVKELGEARQHFGMVFQGAALFDSMTVGENIGLPAVEHRGMRGQELDALIEEKLSLVGLEGLSGLRPSEISGGMKLRAGLARALVTEPEYVLYDEPNAGLDPIMANQIHDLIVEVRDRLNVTGLIVTHSRACAFAVGDRIGVIDDGQIAEEGTIEQMRESDTPLVRDFLSTTAD